MSKLLTPKISPKNKKLDWINHIASTHNLICGCPEPLQHTVEEIINQEPTIKIPCKKCLGSGPEDTTPGEDGFGVGDLEALFAGDFGDEKDTENTR
nr:MAG: hypothetical protein [Betatorquevirus sp.]